MPAATVPAGTTEIHLIYQTSTTSSSAECWYSVAYHILEGWTIGAATEQARVDLLEFVKKYKPVELVSVPLYYNRKYLVLEGDHNWRLGLRTADRTSEVPANIREGRYGWHQRTIQNICGIIYEDKQTT